MQWIVVVLSHHTLWTLSIELEDKKTVTVNEVPDYPEEDIHTDLR